MSDPRKNFRCPKCGTIFNDRQRIWGKQTFCPVCKRKQMFGVNAPEIRGSKKL